ncbi:hypothetical protein [Kitasatospora sp. NPDC093679]|uniref:hypothetical protein n=1 Tax=Kitasatospora sp. NPDC093679 TaxID=3154983 RepID=UPI0034440578
MTVQNGGTRTDVSAPPSDLLLKVRHALMQAGFRVDEASDGHPGLSVRDVPAGVVVRWAVSDGFAALAHEQPHARDENLKAVVQAAVAGLLAQLGHTVTSLSDDGDLIVLAQEQPEQRGRTVPR